MAKSSGRKAMKAVRRERQREQERQWDEQARGELRQCLGYVPATSVHGRDNRGRQCARWQRADYCWQHA